MKKASTKQPGRTPGRTRDALQIIDRMIGDDNELGALVAEAGVSGHIAQLIYDARTAAGLTQAELARLIGTKPPVTHGWRMPTIGVILSPCSSASRKG